MSIWNWITSTIESTTTAIRDEYFAHRDATTNPANGQPMVGSVDIHGNPYGTDAVSHDHHLHNSTPDYAAEHHVHDHHAHDHHTYNPINDPFSHNNHFDHHHHSHDSFNNSFSSIHNPSDPFSSF